MKSDFSSAKSDLPGSIPATPSPEARFKKPRLALAVATALGVGYIPKAPGTFGSLVGIAVAILTHPVSLIMIVGLLFFSGVGLGFDVPMFRASSFRLWWPSSLSACWECGAAPAWPRLQA